LEQILTLSLIFYGPLKFFSYPHRPIINNLFLMKPAIINASWLIIFTCRFPKLLWPIRICFSPYCCLLLLVAGVALPGFQWLVAGEMLGE
jgi:hypothetical protein